LEVVAYFKVQSSISWRYWGSP